MYYNTIRKTKKEGGDNCMELHLNIKKRRKELKMTQEKLAEKTGYTSRTSIAKIEAGKVDLPQSKIVEFAKALKTTPGELMGINKEVKKEQEESARFRWVARNAKKMNDEQLKKLKQLMEITFDIIDEEEDN